MEKIFLETERLYLREIACSDFDDLKDMLQDTEVMYAWEYTFSDAEVSEWIDKNLARYKTSGLGYFIAVDKITGRVAGQAALMPDIINNNRFYEIGYILKKQYWHKGYAAECARALAEYAFNELNLDKVIFEIRPENMPSRRVAEKLGAKIEGEFIKRVKDKDMRHLIYGLSNGFCV